MKKNILLGLMACATLAPLFTTTTANAGGRVVGAYVEYYSDASYMQVVGVRVTWGRCMSNSGVTSAYKITDICGFP